MGNNNGLGTTGKIIGGTVGVILVVLSIIGIVAGGSTRIAKVESCAESARAVASEASVTARANQLDIVSIKKDVERLPVIESKLDTLLKRVPE